MVQYKRRSICGGEPHSPIQKNGGVWWVLLVFERVFCCVSHGKSLDANEKIDPSARDNRSLCQICM